MALTEELSDKVKALYRENLHKEFGESFAFNPILVEPAYDEDGEETFRVTIVYEGESERPDPHKIIAVMTSMTSHLTSLGLPWVLVESYVPKREFPLLLKMRSEPPWAEMLGQE